LILELIVLNFSISETRLHFVETCLYGYNVKVKGLNFDVCIVMVFNRKLVLETEEAEDVQ